MMVADDKKRSKRYMRNTRNRSQLYGSLSSTGVEIWRHFFWAKSLERQQDSAFLLEFYLLNPSQKEPSAQPFFHAKGSSFAMVRLVRLDASKSQPAAFYSMSEVELSRRILSLRFGRSICLEDAVTGQILTLEKDVGVRFGLASAGSASWELQVAKSQSYGYGWSANRLLTAYRAVGLSWHVGGLKANFDGYLVLDDEEFKVSAAQSYGFQDKVWGSYLGQHWIKLYGGMLYNEDGSAASSDVLTIFRYEKTIWGKSEGFRYHFIYVHDGVLYDFSSDLNKMVYTFQEQVDEQSHKAAVLLEVVSPTQRLSVELTIDQQAITRVNYAHPKGQTLTLALATPAHAKVELHRLIPLSGWQLEFRQKLSFALYESSSL